MKIKNMNRLKSEMINKKIREEANVSKAPTKKRKEK